MRSMVSIILIFLSCLTSSGQTLIHAHNDYQKPEPLVNALRNKVFSIEADVYLVKDSLLVAHDTNELNKAPSLKTLYIDPIIDLYKKNNGHISSDSSYAPVLMIDIKENGVEVVAALIKLLSTHQIFFERSINPKAVQVVISGDRGSILKWNSYPAYIFFDGRPNEIYDNVTLKRVAFISDSYINYIRPVDSIDLRIQKLVEKTHDQNKLLRLWSIPDNPSSWDHLKKLGVDIINTDKPAACRNYFEK